MAIIDEWEVIGAVMWANQEGYFPWGQIRKYEVKTLEIYHKYLVQ
jgi:hypothetical protein